MFQIDRMFITKNVISTIDAHAFQHMKKLSSLQLGENEITEIPDISGTDGQLRSLSLTYNKITTVNCADLGEEVMEHLEQLRLYVNPINGTIDVCEAPALHTFYLQGGFITRVAERTLSSLRSLKYFSLEKSLLEEFPDISAANESLLNLNLKQNNIRQVKVESLKPLVKLRRLDISYNMITGKLSIPCLKELKDFLYAQMNDIEEFGLEGDMSTPCLPLLTELNLANNKLTVVHSSLFYHMQNLLDLDVSNNWLQQLPVVPAGISYSSPVNIKVESTTNNIYCGPQLCGLNLNSTVAYYEGNINCKKPPALNGQLAKEMNPSQVCPGNRKLNTY